MAPLGALPLKKQHHRLPNGVPSFSIALARKYKVSLARAKDAVVSARFRALTFEIATWLELGRWMKSEDDLVRSRGEVPIEVFAAEQLQRRYRKVRKRGKKLAQLATRKRHKLRIQVKKLRYANEFFTELFQGKKTLRRRKKFTSALKRLQDGLGDLNDIAVDERLLARASQPKRAFAAGLLTGRDEARENEAMSAALQGYAKLIEVKSFWP